MADKVNPFEDPNFTPVEYDPQYILQVNHLKKYFPIKSGMIAHTVGYVKAVDGVTFNLKRGTTMGLVGESGCGKTTTGRTVLRLYDSKTAGQVLFNGQEIYDLSHKELRALRTKMQIIFQDPFSSLDPKKTVSQIIAEPIIENKILKGKHAIEERVLELMETVGLAERYINTYPHELDGGRRQRIGIARALAMEPQLIICDEPVSALDVSIQAQILNLISDLQKELGITFIFIAHDLAVIQHISDRVVVMYLGKVMEISKAEELYHNPKHPYTTALLSAAPIPDPVKERSRQRIILSGDVPSPDKERKGCYFYDRCPHRMEHCSCHIPPMFDVGPEHKVACWLYDPSVDKSKKK